VHVDEEVLAPIRARYGEPAVVEWEGEITAREFAVATYDPARTHDVTLFILNGSRLALIRKPIFPPDIWRPPGGGVKPGEDFVAAVEREGLEETGLRIELERYLVDMRARFIHDDSAHGQAHHLRVLMRRANHFPCCVEWNRTDRRFVLAKESGVDLDRRRMLGRNVDIFEDGIDRANDLALFAVDAYFRVDVELRRAWSRMNAGDRTDLHTSAVIGTQAGDDVRHL